MSVAEVLRRLQMVPSPQEVFPCLDTRYSKYSGTNYAASSSELPAIREVISERKTQIDDIDNIIQHVGIILERFRGKREQIVSSMKMHEGFISCIRRLPSETLEEIFVHCLPPEMHKQPTVQAAPLLLTGICRDWREVVLDAPRLWCSLVVKEPEQQQLSRYDSWLKKAKSCPLSLKAIIRGKAVLDFLQVYTSRLKNLTINFDEADGLSLLFSDIPILERLYLSGNMAKLKGAQTISISQPQPRLHILTIHSPTFNTENFSAFNPGWTNLTHVALVLGNDQSLVRDPILSTLLQMCPNLEHVVFISAFVFLFDNSVSFTHSKLRILKIADVEWDSSLLHTLTLPNLCHLSVRGLLDPDDETLHSEDMFIPDHPLLEGNHRRILTIKFPFYTSYDHDHMFTVLNPGWTTLTHLRLEFNAIEGVLFRVLDLGSNLEDLLISSMDIGMIDDDDDDFSTPVSIIHPTLRSLSIGISSGRFAKVLDMLTLPGLCHLDQSLPGYQGSSWPHANFKAFLSRSQCPLETLKVKGSRIPNEEREEFGSLVSTLMHVDLYEKQVTDGPVYSWSR